LTFDENHEKLKEFDPYKPASKGGDSKGKKSEKNQDKPKRQEETTLTITSLFRPTAELARVFNAVHEDFKKESLYTRQEAMDTMWEYTKANELQTEDNLIKLDALLAKGIYKKQKNEGDQVSKEDIAVRFIKALQANFDVCRDGISQIISGKLEPVVSREERRGGHKSVTRVKGLETFGVSPANVAKELRKSFAASTTVNNIPGSAKSKSPALQEVIIQGKMNKAVVDYLVSTYKIPAKFIETASK